MNTKWFFEISQGAGRKMYTLWKVPVDMNCHVSPVFVKNLSIDKDKALSEAENRANKAGLELIDSSVDNLRVIVREGDGLMPFGKYYGQPIAELPDSYLCWLADTNRDFVSPYVQDLAIELCLSKGLIVEFEGRFISKRLAEYIQNDRLAWGHHHEDKAKVQLELKVLKSRVFESFYGFVFVVTFLDINTGLKYEYKGASWNAPEKEIFEVKATVKLGEYNNVKKTYLQRIKVL